MINLREILSSIYADRSGEDLHAWLDQKSLLNPFKHLVAQLNSSIINEADLIKHCRIVPVGHLASYILETINKQIAIEANTETMREMENILGDICSAILMAFLQNVKSDRQAVWMQIHFALKDTCELYHFDFNQMIRFLKIDTTVSYLRSQKGADHVIAVPAVPSLLWKGSKKKYMDFLDIFVDQKMIKARKKTRLGNIFENPLEPLGLLFDGALADLTLQFFYTLRKSGLVSHSGCKGFYQVLEYHILDFKKVFLKNQDAKRRINALRQNSSKWTDNQRRIDSWLCNFTETKTGPQPVPQA